MLKKFLQVGGGLFLLCIGCLVYAYIFSGLMYLCRDNILLSVLVPIIFLCVTFGIFAGIGKKTTKR